MKSIRRRPLSKARLARARRERLPRWELIVFYLLKKRGPQLPERMRRMDAAVEGVVGKSANGSGVMLHTRVRDLQFSFWREDDLRRAQYFVPQIIKGSRVKALDHSTMRKRRRAQ